jgi:hypothetical protein
MPSPDSADPVVTTSAESADAAADGVRLAELAASLPLSRASVFEVIKALGITTAKGPGPEGRGRVAWLSTADADRVSAAAHAVHRGEVRIADLSKPTRQTRQTVALAAPQAGSAASADPPDAGPFLARLEAAERAIRSGLGLSTTETAWILGVRPGSSPLTRGGITATRTGWNCWRLQSADAGRH